MNRFTLILAFVCLTTLLAGANYFIIKETKTTVKVTITDKERVSYGSGETIQHKYLIFTDIETFECTDAIMAGKFNSSDMYGRLELGKTYKLTVYGVRNEYLSYYRNIIKAELVDENEF